jgi:hypothetical protein
MHWHQEFVCQSKTCRRKMIIDISVGSGSEVMANPTCPCGALMKGVYNPPVLRRLQQSEIAQHLNEPSEHHGIMRAERN